MGRKLTKAKKKRQQLQDETNEEEKHLDGKGEDEETLQQDICKPDARKKVQIKYGHHVDRLTYYEAKGLEKKERDKRQVQELLNHRNFEKLQR